jgi:hypothetical protein
MTADMKKIWMDTIAFSFLKKAVGYRTCLRTRNQSSPGPDKKDVARYNYSPIISPYLSVYHTTMLMYMWVELAVVCST